MEKNLYADFFLNELSRIFKAMIWFPNAKINLGLNVVEKRSDGFHNIETVFYPAPWRDALEIIEDRYGLRSEKIKISFSGIRVEGDPEKNLVARAFSLLDQLFDLPPVKIHLHKAIPMGAGLGGGSADAAFTLKGLSELFALKLEEEKLVALAAQLGSDCAFFIRNRPAFATQKGDRFEDCGIDLSAYKMIIVWPGIHSNTAEAYAGIAPARPAQSCRDIVLKYISHWKEELENDFEKTIFARYPEIGRVKEKLYSAGAVYAAMSGSGSAVFGLFREEIPQQDWPANYKVLAQ